MAVILQTILNLSKYCRIMKRLFSIVVILMTAVCVMFADEIRSGSSEYIRMHQTPQGGSHIDTGIVPADMPDVYYDSGEGTLTIIGYGAVACYEVEIVSGGDVALTDTVNGTSDTVDVSGLPAGSYTLTCTTPIGHVFSGQFTVP